MELKHWAVQLVVMLLNAFEALSQPTVVVNSLTPDYDQDMFSKKIHQTPHFIMYYVPWCGQCQTLTETFDQLSDIYDIHQPDTMVTFAKVDCTLHTALCSQNNVLSYPTIIFYWYDESTGRKYRGLRDPKSLDNYLMSVVQAGPATELQMRLLQPMARRNYELTSETFTEELLYGQHFVDFYAPWCSHCKDLSPTWDRLRIEFGKDPIVDIVKVDCTQSKQLCTKQRIKAYPTLQYYSNGQKVKDYQGERQFGKLVEFVKQMKIEQDERFGMTQESVPSDHGTVEPQVDESSLVSELSAAVFHKSVNVVGLRVMLFHVPWCPHCQSLQSTFLMLAEHFNKDTVLSFAKIDCSKYQSICLEQNVLAYPTVALYTMGLQTDRYGGSRTLDDMQKYLTERKQAHHIPDGKVSQQQQQQQLKDSSDFTTNEMYPMLTLTRASYSLKIEVAYTFIKYYQPWCEHCKTLAPIWSQLARMYSKHHQITIASVNCAIEKSLCEENKIDRYPMLIMYHDGEKVKEYKGVRDIDSLSTFIDEILNNTAGPDLKDEL